MKSKPRSSTPAVLVAASVIMLAVHAEALSASVYLSTDLWVTGPGPNRTFSEQVLTGTDATQPQQTISADAKYDGSATWAAGAGARAQAGSVGVYSYASADGLTTGNPSNTTSSAVARYTDSVSLSSSGSSTIDVRLDAELLFDFVASANPTAPGMGGSGSAYGDGWFLGSVEWNFYNSSGAFVSTHKWGVCSGWFYGCYGGPYPQSSEGLHAHNLLMTVQSGGRVDITTYIFAYSAAGLYNNITGMSNGGQVRWDTKAFNSLRNGITVLTEGATLAADSGHSYVFVPHETDAPPPVPLPAAAWLLLSGLGSLGLVGRRRKAG